MHLLAYSDSRSIKKWCTSHNVKLCGIGMKWVLKHSFEKALLLETMRGVQVAYGAEWLNVLSPELIQNPQYEQILNELKKSCQPYYTYDVALIPMSNDPIELPKKNQQHPIVKLWCKKCRTEPSLGCGHKDHRGRKLEACNDGSLGYKIVIRQGEKRFTKQIPARNFDEAIHMGITLQNGLLKQELIPVQPALQVVSINKPDRSIGELKDKYLNFIKDIEAPPQLKQELSTEYIKEIERVFTTLQNCLQKHNLKFSDSIDVINDRTTGFLHDYLLNEKKYSDRSYDKNIGALKTFIKWSQLEDSTIKNPFLKIKKRDKGHEPIAINKEELDAILKACTKENGFVISPGKVKVKRNVFYDFLPEAYLVAAYTGARREELINMKYSSVIEDKTGRPALIKIQNYKVNHIQHRSGNNLKYHYIPVSKSLNKIIQKGYAEYKTMGEDKFLIGNDFQGNRDNMLPDILSRSFSHFNKEAGNERELSFGSLRKRYITQLEIFTKGRAIDVTGHSGRAVLDQHYLDKRVLAEATKNFEVFTDPSPERLADLSEIRKNQTNYKTIER